MFVSRAGAAHDLQVEHAIQRFFVSQGFEAWAGDDVAFGVSGLPGSDLPSDLFSRSRSVAGHDLDVDAGIKATLDSSRNISTDRVGNSDDT